MARKWDEDGQNEMRVREEGSEKERWILIKKKGLTCVEKNEWIMGESRTESGEIIQLLALIWLSDQWNE